MDENFEFFQRNKDEIRARYPGKKFVLLKNGKDISGFDSQDDAETAAKLLFKGDGLFSVQEIDAAPLDLGCLSYVLL